FKTEEVGQRVMSQATSSPISVMATAGEGGAWGIAILSAYHESGYDKLEDFLAEKIFSDTSVVTIEAGHKEVAGFEKFIERYKQGLEIERSAVQNLR
ncbi:MAG: ATPase, partial [Mycoplasmatales bacterium]